MSIKDHTRKLCCSEAAWGFQPQRLRENVYLGPTLGRETKRFLDGEIGDLPKVL
jgi:hypothetical protein